MPALQGNEDTFAAGSLVVAVSGAKNAAARQCTTKGSNWASISYIECSMSELELVSSYIGAVRRHRKH